MARGRAKSRRKLLPGAVESGLRRLMLGSYGLLIVTVACGAWASLATWSVHDPSLNNATRAVPRNVLGGWGPVAAPPAEKLAPAERPWRHFRRFLHGRRSRHRAVPA